MVSSQAKAVQNYRERQRHHGIVRTEIQLPASDKPWIKRLTRMLCRNTKEAAEIRCKLRAMVKGSETADRKALLESAPLKGITLTRNKDYGRDLDL